MNLRDIKRWSKKVQQPEPPASPGRVLLLLLAVVVFYLLARGMNG